MSKNMYDENGILKSNVTEIEDKVKTDLVKELFIKVLMVKSMLQWKKLKLLINCFGIV